MAKPHQAHRNDKGYRVGESHPLAKLTDAEVDKVFDLRDQGLALREIAQAMGLSKSGVFGILSGRRRCQTPVTDGRWERPRPKPSPRVDVEPLQAAFKGMSLKTNRKH